MQTIRTFVAIPLDASIQRAAGRLIRRLADDHDGIKWVPVDNLHLTLKFLGDVDNVDIPRVCDYVGQACEGVEPFELSFGGTGGFPNAQRPRVIYVGAQDDSGTLCPLVARLETRLADLGFKPEPRDYTPHLTLGRTRGGSRRANDAVVERVEKEARARLGQTRVDAVHVMGSFLEKGGPSYNVLGSVELGA